MRRFCAWLWRVTRGLARGLRWLTKPAVAAALAVLILGDFYTETRGLPAPVVEIVGAWLGQHGFLTDIRGVRAGVFHGVVAERVIVFDGTRPNVPMLEAESLVIVPQWGRLLTGTFVPRRLLVTGCRVYPPAPPRAARQGPQAPAATLSGALRLGTRRLELTSLTGDVAGIRVQAQGRIRELPVDLVGDGTRPFGWPSVVRLFSPASRLRVERWLARVAAEGVPQNDGVVSIQFDVPLEHLEKTSVWGSFSLADMAWRGVDIRRVRTRFSLRDQALVFDQLLLQLPGDQRALASGEFDLQTRRWHGHAEGVLNPEVAWRLCERPWPAALKGLRFREPVAFTADAGPSLLALQGIDVRVSARTHNVEWNDLLAGQMELTLAIAPNREPSASVQIANLSWHGTVIRDLHAAMVWADDVLRVTELTANVDRKRREQCTATLALYPRTRELALTATGHLAPGTLAALLPNVPASLRQLAGELEFAAEVPEFHLSVARSPFAPGQWTGTLGIALGAGRFRDLSVASGRLDASFAAGTIVAKPSLVISENPRQTVVSELTYRTATQRLSGQASGRLYADRAYRGLRLPANYYSERIVQKGEPAEFTAELQDSPLSPAGWRASAHVETRDTAYEDLVFARAVGDIQLTPDALQFQNLSLLTAAGEPLEGGVSIVLSGGVDVSVSGTVHGDPRLGRVFMARGRCRENYMKAWQDVAWDPQKLPTVRLDHLRYREAPGASGWRFEMDAAIACENAVWRGLKTTQIRAAVVMDLPRSITVRNVEVHAPALAASGNASFDFVDQALCRFDLRTTADPQQVLQVINPAWQSLFGGATFADSTESEWHGSFFLGQDPRPRLRGTLRSPLCQYGRFRFEEFATKWQFDGERLTWAPVTAKLFGGKLTANGNFDYGADAGQLALSAEDVELAPVMGTSKGKPITGKLSGNCHVGLSRPTAGGRMQIDGTGQLAVAEGDLLNLPPFNRLGEAVGVGALGRITKLNASLTFAGGRAIVPDFYTDGTILALRGAGEYDWQKETLNFKTRGEALKTTRVVPMLLMPLFWMFEAELTGTVAEPHWRMVRGLRSLLPGGGEAPAETAPTTKTGDKAVEKP